MILGTIRMVGLCLRAVKDCRVSAWIGHNGKRRRALISSRLQGCKSMASIRAEFESIKAMPRGTITRTVTDDTIRDYRYAYDTFRKDGVSYDCPCPDHPTPIEGPVERDITYVAPFTKCDREADYRTAGKNLKEEDFELRNTRNTRNKRILIIKNVSRLSRIS